jgi:futalosine hydrolase
VTDDPSRPLGLIATVSLETEPVRRRLDDMRPLIIGRKAAWSGKLGGAPVILLAGGMGKTNAAQALTALLETRSVRGVIGFGVGGAYGGSGLDVGGIALATSEIYGDEGVEAPEGWLSTQAIGIPLLETPGGVRFNELVLDGERVDEAGRALAAAGLRFSSGPFVTVSACSGTRARGDVLRARFGALCESMEGAAGAHVAALYGVPFLEVRGISNLVEDRDLGRWKLHAAAEVAAEAVERITARWAGA